MNLTTFIAELEELSNKVEDDGYWVEDEAGTVIDALPKLLACVKVLSEACRDAYKELLKGDGTTTECSAAYLLDDAIAKCESIIKGE